MKKKTFSKLVLILAVMGLIAAFFIFNLGRYLTLDAIKQQQQDFTNYYAANTIVTLGIYFIVYIVVTALSLPGAAILTLLGGALFGVITGVIVISFASTIGATLAFLASRFLFRDYVQNKFGHQLKTINDGIEKEGSFYLFTLRLIPIIPFFLINLLMGLTPFKTLKYYLVSQIGMLAGTIVYVFAGTQLATIKTLGDILSIEIIGAFCLIGIFPLIAKKIIDYIRFTKVLRKYRKPKKFDYNMVVIGAGSAGLVSSYIAAAVKAKVALIEKHKMGGDCLNTGCVPSKALIKSAKILSYAKHAKTYGFDSAKIEFNFGKVMERVQDVISQVAPHDSTDRYSQLGVECITGTAFIKDPYTVEVDGKSLTTKNIIVATGGRPLVPPFPGLDKIKYLTSDTIWNLRKLPERFLVLGGGPIGCELAQCFARFGSKVTIVEMAPQILIREEDEVVKFTSDKFKNEGIELLTSHKAKEFINEDGKYALICEKDGKEVKVPFDQVLIALGRRANTQGFGLEELGIELSPRGTVEADPYLRTNYPNIFVCGDVVGPYQFTHTAGHQAWYASVNALFQPFKKFAVDYRVIPWCTFTDPEVARVGLNEKDAKAQNIPYEVTTYGIDELDRAIADSAAEGLVKVLTVPGKDKILGVTIVGTHAGDLIIEFVTAMKNNIGLNKILGTIHIYPTLAEANKYAAGNWKRAHAPEKLLRFVEKFHTWRR
ncbi:MAG: dihydrolipoyl dehydrogenase [Deltaproteobacteria bacterium]|jgi:dihydrolipoamide dehydrogenase|nr:dihydrolipoyl dehydrogenase [Deltaproteobacteria bacterium]MBT4528001.1 dihydrolipoyl dehydrogenase [Deltaproteobacteria bacterium]